MIKNHFVFILILLSTCTNSDTITQTKSNGEQTDIRDSIQTNKEFLRLLHSQSSSQKLPYGKEEIIDMPFPEHWYCGGDPINPSSHILDPEINDSMKYASPYFSILAFNRLSDLSSMSSNAIDGRTHINKINTLLKKYKYLDPLPQPLEKSLSAFIKLPETNGCKVYGVLSQTRDFDYNPLYLVIKDNQITDILSTYERSKGETLINKSCFIDKNYVFHCLSFRNTDGVEVETGMPEMYTVSNQGTFIAYFVHDGNIHNKQGKGTVVHHAKDGSWIDFIFDDGSSSPKMYVESFYNQGTPTGEWQYFEINNNYEKGAILFTERYKNGVLLSVEKAR